MQKIDAKTIPNMRSGGLWVGRMKPVSFMARMVFSKLLDEMPSLKIITHHGGGMIPFFEGRVGPGRGLLLHRTDCRANTLFANNLKSARQGRISRQVVP